MADKRLITYLGPKRSDESYLNGYRLPADSPDGEDLVLVKGIPSKATEAQIRALKKDKDHKFQVGDAAGEDADAPWPDYPGLDADQVIERLGDPDETPSADVATAVVDWESGHGKRKTVIEAAKHQAEAYRAGEESS